MQVEAVYFQQFDRAHADRVWTIWRARSEKADFSAGMPWWHDLWLPCIVLMKDVQQPDMREACEFCQRVFKAMSRRERDDAVVFLCDSGLPWDIIRVEAVATEAADGASEIPETVHCFFLRFCSIDAFAGSIVTLLKGGIDFVSQTLPPIMESCQIVTLPKIVLSA